MSVPGRFLLLLPLSISSVSPGIIILLIIIIAIELRTKKVVLFLVVVH